MNNTMNANGIIHEQNEKHLNLNKKTLLQCDSYVKQFINLMCICQCVVVFDQNDFCHKMYYEISKNIQINIKFDCMMKKLRF